MAWKCIKQLKKAQHEDKLSNSIDKSQIVYD